MILIACVKTLGKFVLLLAGTAFIVGLSLLLLGSWLWTYPLHRQSPRKRKIQASVEFASAAAQLASVIGETMKAEADE